MKVVSKDVVDQVHAMAYLTEEKVKAIKFVRGELGLGLREAKELIESDFGAADLANSNLVLETECTPGYYVDRVFELAAELAECYTKLQELGVNVGGGK